MGAARSTVIQPAYGVRGRRGKGRVSVVWGSKNATTMPRCPRCRVGAMLLKKPLASHTEMVQAMNVTILMSGGIDSTACAHYFLKRGDNVTGVFVDYGQKAIEQERNAVKLVSRHFNLSVLTLTFSSGTQYTSGEIVGRNAFLVFSALMGGQIRDGILCLGVHAGTGYYDCGLQFIERMADIVDSYSNGTVQLLCPFVSQDKAFIYSYVQEHNIPLHLTYSCEEGTVPTCGKCLSCMDRNAL